MLISTFKTLKESTILSALSKLATSELMLTKHFGPNLFHLKSQDCETLITKGTIYQERMDKTIQRTSRHLPSLS